MMNKIIDLNFDANCIGFGKACLVDFSRKEVWSIHWGSAGVIIDGCFILVSDR